MWEGYRYLTALKVDGSDGAPLRCVDDTTGPLLQGLLNGTATVSMRGPVGVETVMMISNGIVEVQPATPVIAGSRVESYEPLLQQLTAFLTNDTAVNGTFYFEPNEIDAVGESTVLNAPGRTGCANLQLTSSSGVVSLNVMERYTLSLLADGSITVVPTIACAPMPKPNFRGYCRDVTATIQASATASMPVSVLRVNVYSMYECVDGACMDIVP